MFVRKGGASVEHDEEVRKRFRNYFRAGKYEEAKKMIAEQPSLCLVSLQSNSLLLPLHVALVKGEVGLVEFLLAHGADPLLPDTEGLQAVHYACLTGNPKILRIVLSLPSVSVVEVNLRYNTPLHYFAQWWLHDDSAPGFFKQLIDKGAEVNAQNIKGETPLHNTVWKNNLLVAKLLLEAGADPNRQTKRRLIDKASFMQANSMDIIEGETPLHWAAKMKASSVPLVKLLLIHGADPTLKSKEGKTPGDLAFENDRKDLVSLLSPELTETANIKATEQSSKEEEKTKSTKKTNTVPARDHRQMFTAMAKISLEDLRVEGPKPQLKRASSFNKEKEHQVTTDVKAKSTTGAPVKLKKKKKTKPTEAIKPRGALKRSKSTSSLRIADTPMWHVRPEDVKMAEKLGAGGFAIVYKGEWKRAAVAVKRLLKTNQDRRLLQSFRAEIALMSNLSHHNVVRFFGACLEESNTFFILEYASNGDLHSYIKRKNPSWRQRLSFAEDIARGMAYLHEYTPPILHMDLKSPNVLLDSSLNAKVADFGLSKPDYSMGGVEINDFGSIFWTAPEMTTTSRYSKEADVYAYGLVLWEILTGEFPFHNYKPSELIPVLREGQRPPIPPDVNPAYAELMTSCWHQTPSSRPTFGQAYDALLLITQDEDRKQQQEANTPSLPPVQQPETPTPPTILLPEPSSSSSSPPPTTEGDPDSDTPFPPPESEVLETPQRRSRALRVSKETHQRVAESIALRADDQVVFPQDYDTRIYFWLQQLGQLRLLDLFQQKKFEDLGSLTEEQLVKLGVLDSSTQNHLLNSVESIFGEDGEGAVSVKDAPAVPRKGWLLLKGNNLRHALGGGWVPRFFILLSDGRLQYFASEGTPSPVGGLHLGDLMAFRRNASLPGVEGQEVLQLVTPHQTLSLRSDVPHDIDQWETHINSVIESL